MFVSLYRSDTLLKFILLGILFRVALLFICQGTNGDGGIWTLAPLLTTCTLSRGVPSAILGTSPNKSWYQIKYAVEKVSPAERVGFEPTRPCGQTVFKTAALWPLRYLSMFDLADLSRSAQESFYQKRIFVSTDFFRNLQEILFYCSFVKIILSNALIYWMFSS